MATSYQVFWEGYRKDHTKRNTKIAHAIAFVFIVFGIGHIVMLNPINAAILIVAGLVVSFASHYMFEGNKPTILVNKNVYYSARAFVQLFLGLVTLKIPLKDE